MEFLGFIVYVTLTAFAGAEYNSERGSYKYSFYLLIYAWFAAIVWFGFGMGGS